MKILGKWIVKAIIDGKSQITGSFMTKKEAIEALDTYFKRISETEWENTKGTRFTIEKNIKEWG